MQTTTPDGSPSRADTFIVEAVGDVARPEATLPITGDISHLPGTANPLVGIARIFGQMRRGVDYQLDIMRKYGPVFQDRFGPARVVSIYDPALVAEIARNRDGVWSTALGWRLITDGLEADSPTMDAPVHFDFEAHKDVRKLLQPAFSRASMEHYIEQAATEFGAVTDAWVARGRVSFKRAARTAFASLANRIFLGIDDPEESARIDQWMADFWGGPLALVRHPMGPTWRRAMKGYAGCREVLQRRRREVSEHGGSDMFARLCQGERLDWMDDDTLVRLFFGVMTAAFDTTSMGVTSMAYLLATHPEWQDRLRNEAAELAPDGLNFDTAKKLVQHDRAWKESLRLFPVSNGLPRRPLRDVEIGGYRIPAGAYVFAAMAPAMRDPAVWTDPDRFDPDRFAPERAEGSGTRGAFLPFGAGAHACIGAMLSGMEATAFWHALLSRCRIRLEKPYRGQHQFRPLGVVSGDVDLVLEPL